MEEMRIYVANLGKYTEGELVGAWFSYPFDKDEIAERIGLNEEYEEYAIHDYELPFDIGEYESIDDINNMCELVLGMPEHIQENIGDLLTYFSSIEELSEKVDDIIFHSGYDDMIDLAYYFVNECGYLGELNETALMYIDYEAYARDLEIEGNFIETKDGIIEVLD